MMQYKCLIKDHTFRLLSTKTIIIIKYVTFLNQIRESRKVEGWEKRLDLEGNAVFRSKFNLQIVFKKQNI